MSYVISVSKDNVNYCVRADQAANSFVLIPVESDSDLTKVFCHPYRIGAVQILNWINENQDTYKKFQEEMNEYKGDLKDYYDNLNENGILMG